MALAIHFDQLLRERKVKDMAQLARLGQVTQARVTQIMNLLNLSPEIQEKLLFLPLIAPGKNTIHERQLRPLVRVTDWRKQCNSWLSLLDAVEFVN